MQQSTPYEIPQPSNTSTNKQPLIPSVKLLDIQNPPPIDFDQLNLTANEMHNRSHSLDILRNDDQPHTNEVTYCDSHSADTYEVYQIHITKTSNIYYFLYMYLIHVSDTNIHLILI